MKKKLISVLITNYNKEKFIDRCLKSVIKQNFKNFEIVVFDDCSNDNSLRIIKKYRNIKLIKNKIRSKQSNQLNQINGIIEAFKKSSGEIICLLDSDDFFTKNKLKIIYKYFMNNKKNCVYNFPKTQKSQFNFKYKRESNRIWPTIFPTSCLSFTKKSFKIFLNNVINGKFPNLEIDARLIIFYNSFFNEYNKIPDKLTIYNFDPYGITAKINRFSLKWWLRRYEAFQYLKIILEKKNSKFVMSLDYLITSFIVLLIKKLL